jgi:hypothetical protein
VDAVRRKREIAIREAQLGEPDDKLYAKLFPVAPKWWAPNQRSITVVASDDRVASNGEYIDVDGIDLEDFLHTRGSLLGHEGAPIGWVSDIIKHDHELLATICFPRKGIDERSDAVWRGIVRGRYRRCSIGFSTIEKIGDRVVRSVLREISITETGGNEAARIVSVAGKSVSHSAVSVMSGDWRSPSNPRVPKLYEVGGDPAAVSYWESRQRERMLAAQWYQG